jgi:hypothetical protein
MDAAIARARKEVDSFIEELSKSNGTNFSAHSIIDCGVLIR